jgi:ubiquinone/menaquinone biosynthesis C-methylase UbiE
MNRRDAVELIREAIPRREGAWADLGCGDGTITRALAELVGPNSRIYAVDRDATAISALARGASVDATQVIPVVADFARPFELPGLGGATLEGILLANALHYVREADTVLARLAEWLRPGGRIVIVEYDQTNATQWVPYPIPTSRLHVLAASAGLSPFVLTASRPSAFGGTLYTAAAERLGSSMGSRPRPITEAC